MWLRVGWSGARLVRQMAVGQGGRQWAADGGRPGQQSAGNRPQAAGGRWQAAGGYGVRQQVADRGRPGGTADAAVPSVGPPTRPADASDLPLQQHQRRTEAGYAARAAM